MKKTILLLLMLSLCFLACSSAVAITYPNQSSNIVDGAMVLGQQTKQDLTTLCQRYNKATEGELYVVTHHFLGGKATSDYADELFAHWSLEENDALFVMVIGEETHALSMGKKAQAMLTLESENLLISQYFLPYYMNREYDQALVQFVPALMEQLATKKNASFSFEDLFNIGKEEIRNRVPFSFGEERNAPETPQEKEQNKPEKEGKSNTFALVIILIIIFNLVRKNHKKG